MRRVATIITHHYVTLVTTGLFPVVKMWIILLADIVRTI